MGEEKKEAERTGEAKENSQKSFNITEKIRENPWILATFVCGVLTLILLFSMFAGNFTGNVISTNTAGEKFLAYISEQGADINNIKITGISSKSGLYEIYFDYKEEPYAVPYYVTEDGKFVGMMDEVTTASSDTQATEVPKSDKPSVELYVFTYCPYGLQMEKAMIPAVELLGDKINFKIRQIGAMHDAQGCSGSACFEKTEAQRQLCIEKNYPSKFLDYILSFAEDTSIGNCNGDATCLTSKLNALYTKLGIDASKINSCMASEGEKLYNAEVDNSGSKGVSGSPTLIINGVNTQSSRSPEAIKGVICSAFNNVPTECTMTLSTDSASAGFGAGTSSSSTSSASC